MLKLLVAACGGAFMSTNLVCFRHPDYDGKERPQLSCKACCSIFVHALKERVHSGQTAEVDTKKWIDEKRDQAGRQEKSGDPKFGFNPAGI